MRENDVGVFNQSGEDFANDAQMDSNYAYDSN